MSHPDDDLAYGRYHSNPDGGAPRGLVGDTFNKLRESYKYGQPPRPSQAYPVRFLIPTQSAGLTSLRNKVRRTMVLRTTVSLRSPISFLVS